MRATALAHVPTLSSRDVTMSIVRVELSLRLTGELVLAWDEAPGEQRRRIDPAVAERIEALGHEAAEAEQRKDPGPIASARIQLGLALFDLLDGNERALTRRLEQAAESGRGVDLKVVLRGNEDALADHPAAAWRWELLTDHRGPLTIRRDFTLALQLGDARTVEPRPLDFGGLRILFMAYSPRDVEPVLDYEREEEHVLDASRPSSGPGARS